VNSKTDEEKEISRGRYKAAKKVAKNVVATAKSRAYDKLYRKQDTKEGEKEVFKLARARERRTRDFGVVRYIKDENSKVLSEVAEIKEIWQRYFYTLLNGEEMVDSRSRERESRETDPDPQLGEPISKDEIKETLMKMSTGKAEGLDQIPVEIWKWLGEEGLGWLTELFNVILRTAKMPREWTFSTVIPLYKKKEDIQDCNNYRGIKLISHTMKL